MKILFYTIGFRLKFFAMACLLENTLRKFGNDCDVVILTDGEYEDLTSKCKNTKIINLLGYKTNLDFTIRNNAQRFHTPAGYKFDPCVVRMLIHKIIDISSYDRLIYSDSDIVVLNKIESFVNLNKDTMQISKDKKKMSKHKKWPHECTDTIAYCSGFFCLPSISTYWLDTWKERYTQIGLTDQTVLNILIYEGKILAEYINEIGFRKPKCAWHYTKKQYNEVIYYLQNNKKMDVNEKIINILMDKKD